MFQSIHVLQNKDDEEKKKDEEARDADAGKMTISLFSLNVRKGAMCTNIYKYSKQKYLLRHRISKKKWEQDYIYNLVYLRGYSL